MKPAILIALLLACVAPVTAGFAGEISDPDAGYSITIPDGYEYDSGLVVAANVYGFVKSDPAGGIGTAIFLKHLDYLTLRLQPASTDGTLIPGAITWHGSKLDVVEASAQLNGVAVLSERVRVHVRDGAIELIVLGSPDRKEQLLALQSELLSTLEFRPTSQAMPPPSSAQPQVQPELTIQSPPQPDPNVDSDGTSDNNQTAIATTIRNQWLARTQIAVQWIEAFFRQFGLQLLGVYAVGALVFGRVFRSRMGFAAHVRLCVISIVTPMLLGVGLGTGHVVLPFGWIPFAAVELVILVPAIRGYAAPAHLAHPFSKRKGWFRRSSSPRPSIAPADLAITAARPGLPNNHKSLAAKAAADAISADTHMTDYDKLIYLNALDGLTKADLAILEHFAAEIAVPLADLANGIPEPQDEESLGGLISSLRRLEAHGLVSIAIPERKQKIRSYKPHQYAGVNPWLLKVATIMPHGKKLIQLLKHGDTMFAQDRDGANQGAILNQAPSRLSLQ